MSLSARCLDGDRSRPDASVTPRRVVPAVAALLLTLAVAGASAAEPTPKELRGELDAAAALIADGAPAKAAARLAETARALGELAGRDKPPAGLRVLLDRCRALRDDLELEGVDVTAITLPSPKPAAGPSKSSPDALAAAAVPGKPAPPGRPSAKPAEGFTTHVAPILARHCGGCHIAGRKGGFQMTSYAGLMKTGMVQPGAGEASRLVETILSGDMPRGGGKVSPDEVGVLIRWINAGAAFDGPDPTLPIDGLARASTAAAQAPPPAAVSAVKLKDGEVSFAAAVAPVLVEHCSGCHDATQPESNLSMASLERLLRGGRGGPPIVSGRGSESLLVKKLKGAGADGQRMPLGKQPLPDDVIKTIETWIDQGVKLDMLSPKDDLQAVAAAGRSRHMDHAALRGVRFAAGRRLWTQAIPDEKPVVVERGDVIVLGNLPESRVAKLADVAADVGHKLQTDLVAGDRPLVKGGVVVFALAKSYDLSSFWQAVHSEERPRGALADAGTAGDVVYAAFVPPAGDAADGDADVVATLTEQIAAAALAGRNVPGWFARGAGRALAMRAAPKATVVQAWKRELPAALQRTGSAADVLAGHGDAAATGVVGAAFVGSLAPGPARFAQLIAQLDQGVAFEPAFTTVFRGPPQKLLEAWAAQATRSPRR